jgi:hypothetical protein
METGNNKKFYKQFSVRKPKAFSSLNGKSISLPRSAKRNGLVLAAGALLLLGAFVAGRQFSANNSALGVAGDKIEAPAPVATQNLNKKFEFPLLDTQGKEVAKIAYLIESANLQDGFIYQGKLATAVKGRTFLIFNLKITNPYDKTIEINARDYIRVKMNGSNELLAPEIHNDPVQIQADSTKYTRIGLPINDTDKDLIMIIGELKGKKEEVKLNLQK